MFVILSQKKMVTYFIKIAALCIGLYFVFMHVPAVQAHSGLLESTPAERVVTEKSPPALKLHFSEPIEQELASVTIYDWNANPVFSGHPDEEGERSPTLEFSLPKLDQGTYTVKWSIVSLDGHPVSGSYSFAVGEATAGGVESATSAGDSKVPLIIARTIAQGLLLLGAGYFLFAWLAERRGYPSNSTLFRRGRRIGAVILVLATIAELAFYAASLPPGMMQTVLQGRWDLLLDFPFVLMLFAQLFALILLFIPGMVRGWYLVLWLALAAIPAFGGHVWGMENPLIALIPRIIHQLAIALWLGALCYVILLIYWQRKHGGEVSWGKFRPFFVNRMMVATGLVVLSGITMVFLQTSWVAVVTDWMQWSTLLLFKLIFTAVMIGLAVFQTLKWKKRKTFATPRVIRVEWIIGLVVILIGVWMSQTAYPIAVESYDQTLASSQEQAQAEAAVSIDQLQVGEQQMIIRLSAIDGERPEQLRVEIVMPDHGMKSGPLTAKQTQPGEYHVKLPFTMPGTWHLKITANYPSGQKTQWTDNLFIAGRK
ncbi:hypothetical protein CFK37_18745 [Virgibacillus phasianinus]|uniref:Copper resistance protein CopC n=1 Tax=Virgibacillus phasianinus TaxID=2017483 RepID=A0A220U7D8_9BACI|nr:copper resistance protein CopC [Virgibacillus phasianinus]ASK64048.1 hypothetical protein CFK37_18745 [Virgibacillus phasianinus]